MNEFDKICEDILVEKVQQQDWYKTIDGMSAADLLRLQRYAPSGHPVFTGDDKLYKHFQKRFKKLGGITPALSKQVGWG